MPDRAQRERIIVHASAVGIGGNVLLSALKAGVGLAAGSTAVMMDAVNNLSDAVSSLITMVGTRLAMRPADKNHPMGHGRIEYLTAMIVAAVVMAAGISALIEAVHKIISPVKVNFTYVSAVAIALAVLIKLFLGTYARRMGKKADSGALRASGDDAFFDALISLTTLLSMGIARLWDVNLDGYLGAVISLMIIRAGFTILWGTLQDILGRRMDPGLAADIREEVLKYPGVLGVYDLFLDAYGPGQLAGSLHIEVRDDMTARQIDALSRAISGGIREKFGAMVTCGIYGIDMRDEEVIALRRGVTEAALNHPGVLQVHGFSLDKASKTVTFDVVRDFSAPEPASLIESLTKTLTNRWPEYHFSIHADRDLAD